MRNILLPFLLLFQSPIFAQLPADTSFYNALPSVSPAEVGMDAKLLEDSIRKTVQEGIQAQAFPGAQVLIAKDGKIVFHETYGYHTYDSLRQVRSTDLYDFASITKVTTALPVLMQWYGNGTFDLDAPLKSEIDALKRGNKKNISFRAALAHQARIMPWIPYWRTTLKYNSKYPWRKRWDTDRINDFNFRNKTFERDSSRKYTILVTDSLWLHQDYRYQMYRAIRKSPLNEEAGYIYSGLLFYLLPDLVETRTGEDFETYLKQYLYHPIGAYSLTYNPLRYFPKERIIPTEQDTFFRMELLHGRVHDEGAAMMGGVSCNAGLFGTAKDLARLFQLYLNEGQYGDQQLIAAEAIKEFTRYQFPEAGNRRGLGFDKPPLSDDEPDSHYIASSASPESYGHSGYTGTFVWADPEYDLLFIFLSNRVYPSRNNRKLYSMNIRPTLHQIAYNAIKSRKLNEE